jgi:hypothetical protein
MVVDDGAKTPPAAHYRRCRGHFLPHQQHKAQECRKHPLLTAF